jgi:hypothetical protein
MAGRALVEVRSQKAVGGGGPGKFSGPDRYVAVQIVPNGTEPLHALDYRVAAKRGIAIRYFGKGYYKSSGPRSSLGRAIAAATRYAEQYNLERND